MGRIGVHGRRTFLRTSLLGVVTGVALPRAALAQDAVPGPGPYGSIDGLEPSEHGVVVPQGFTVRLLAASGADVPGTDHRWHRYPDGAACFPTPGGGWIYVCNSEVIAPSGEGGVGAIEMDAAGGILAARTVLSGTTGNCAGGPTPWGTWLSCEEFDTSGGEPADPVAGIVWEVDPTGVADPVPLPDMGAFRHEAAAVDPVDGVVYLTEDQPDGHLYRFTPDAYPDLATGTLDAAVVADGRVTWMPVPDPSAGDTAVRSQVPEATLFAGGEGAWHHEGVVWFSTKHDGRIHAVHLREQRYELVYDQGAFDDPLLDQVDNVTVDAGSGDVYVAEDGSDPLEIIVISTEGEVAPFVRAVGDLHAGSELTGPCFSPDHSRLYFSSQRGGSGEGLTFEVSGPFRGRTVVTPTPASAGDAASEPTPAPTATISAAVEEGAGLRPGDDGGKVDGVGIGVVPAAGIGVGLVALGGAAAWALRRRTARGSEEA